MNIMKEDIKISKKNKSMTFYRKYSLWNSKLDLSKSRWAISQRKNWCNECEKMQIMSTNVPRRSCVNRRVKPRVKTGALNFRFYPAFIRSRAGLERVYYIWRIVNFWVTYIYMKRKEEIVLETKGHSEKDHTPEEIMR